MLNLNDCTKLLTSFPTFAEAVEAYRRTGYVATVRRDRIAIGRRGSVRDLAALRLRRALVGAGLPVFPAWGEYEGEQGTAAGPTSAVAS